ncbi:uncharacterized protein LOC144126625 [Amblyomma americanum]
MLPFIELHSFAEKYSSQLRYGALGSRGVSDACAAASFTALVATGSAWYMSALFQRRLTWAMPCWMHTFGLQTSSCLPSVQQETSWPAFCIAVLYSDISIDPAGLFSVLEVFLRPNLCRVHSQKCGDQAPY